MSLLRKIWNRLNSDDCLDLAAQVSFYFVLSFFPFFWFLPHCSAGYPPRKELGRVRPVANHTLSESGEAMVLADMLELSHGYASFLSIGLLATIWSASSGFVSLMEAFSIAYGVKDGRSYLTKRSIATCATLVAAVFVVSSFACGTWVTWSRDCHQGFRYFVLFQTQWKFARWIVSSVLLLLGIDLINYFLPARARPWRWVTPGTIFVASGLAMATLGMNFYVAYGSNIPKIYGALGGFIVLMLWIYAVNLIVLIGAETDTALPSCATERARELWPPPVVD